MKIEEKSTFCTTQDTTVCPAEYVNGFLFTVRFFVAWHLTFAQLLLYFMNKQACRCLEMHCFHVVHWAKSAAWQIAPSTYTKDEFLEGFTFYFYVWTVEEP